MRTLGQEKKPQNLRIAAFLKRSTVNGPGVRSVIWVQGCPIHCDGCFNPDLWNFQSGEIADINQLFDWIISAEGIDGVTFSGGEPFSQAHALAELGSRLHHRDLTVVTFTGFSYETIRAKRRASWQRLLEETDLLISGPYIAGMHQGHPLAGSCNQEVRVLSDRITIEPEHDGTAAVEIEFTITTDGSFCMTGFPDRNCITGISGRDS